MVFVACGENGVDRASGQLGKLLNPREIGLESRANSVERGRKTDIRFYAVSVDWSLHFNLGIPHPPPSSLQRDLLQV